MKLSGFLHHLSSLVTLNYKANLLSMQRSGVRRKAVIAWESARGTIAMNLASACIEPGVLSEKERILKLWGTASLYSLLVKRM